MKRLITIVVVLILVGCKRQPYDEPVEGTPVFKVTGSLNGSPFNLAAGQSDLYMNTSTTQNEFGVYEFRCDFNRVNCSECDPVMSVVVNDSESTAPGDPCNTDFFEIGLLPLAITNNASNFLELQFHSPNQPGNFYDWDFGDGNDGFGPDVVHEYSTPGIYTVELVIDPPGPGDDINITQSVIVGNPLYLSSPMNIANLPGNEWVFSYPAQLIPDYLEVISWMINGEEYFGNNIHFNSNQVMSVCLNFHNTILDEPGFYCVTFVGNQGPEQVPDFFSYQWQAEDLNIGKAELSYTAPDGRKFTSLTTLNNSPDQSMQITAVENYEAQLDGSYGRKVNVLFTIKMVNVDDPNDVIEFENVEATLGFSCD